MRILDKEKIRHHFLHAVLWTEELDSTKDIEDFLPSAVERATRIIDLFLLEAPFLSLEKYAEHFGEEAESQLGHDIWLSINGHGAGFFDHSLEGDEDVLQNVCHTLRDKHRKICYINQVWVTEQGYVSIE